jgi:hypothetical protein
MFAVGQVERHDETDQRGKEQHDEPVQKRMPPTGPDPPLEACPSDPFIPCIGVVHRARSRLQEREQAGDQAKEDDGQAEKRPACPASLCFTVSLAFSTWLATTVVGVAFSVVVAEAFPSGRSQREGTPTRRTAPPCTANSAGRAPTVVPAIPKHFFDEETDHACRVVADEEKDNGETGKHQTRNESYPLA